jgi:hypothetical protein
MPCEPLQNSINQKLVVMLSLIVVQKTQIQDDKADFNTFLIAGEDSAALYLTLFSNLTLFSIKK